MLTRVSFGKVPKAANFACIVTFHFTVSSQGDMITVHCLNLTLSLKDCWPISHTMQSKLDWDSNSEPDSLWFNGHRKQGSQKSLFFLYGCKNNNRTVKWLKAAQPAGDKMRMHTHACDIRAQLHQELEKHGLCLKNSLPCKSQAAPTKRISEKSNPRGSMTVSDLHFYSVSLLMHACRFHLLALWKREFLVVPRDLGGIYPWRLAEQSPSGEKGPEGEILFWNIALVLRFVCSTSIPELCQTLWDTPSSGSTQEDFYNHRHNM